MLLLLLSCQKGIIFHMATKIYKTKQASHKTVIQYLRIVCREPLWAKEQEVYYKPSGYSLYTPLLFFSVNCTNRPTDTKQKQSPETGVLLDPGAGLLEP